VFALYHNTIPVSATLKPKSSHLAPLEQTSPRRRLNGGCYPCGRSTDLSICLSALIVVVSSPSSSSTTTCTVQIILQYSIQYSHSSLECVRIQGDWEFQKINYDSLHSLKSSPHRTNNQSRSLQFVSVEGQITGHITQNTEHIGSTEAKGEAGKRYSPSLIHRGM
jgi:hypothetical protein